MSTISLTAVVMPAHAATDAEVDALRKEVSELKRKHPLNAIAKF
ncbi:hypothetical protein ACEZPV_010715 [Acinetobacter baumannii]|nr:hypothetical protein [Acinetobacter baumannii]